MDKFSDPSYQDSETCNPICRPNPAHQHVFGNNITHNQGRKLVDPHWQTMAIRHRHIITPQDYQPPHPASLSPRCTMSDLSGKRSTEKAAAYLRRQDNKHQRKNTPKRVLTIGSNRHLAASIPKVNNQHKILSFG